MKLGRLWPGLITAVVLLVFFGVALWLRVGLPYDKVFTPDGIVFTGNDAYYHMRLVEILVNNFPRFPGVDPYLQYPGAFNLIPSFFQWLLGTIVWIVGFGSPSAHTLDLVGAYFPAVLGSLAVVPVYFIAKALWGRHGRWAGLVAAALIAVMPGEFLGRSILGFTDQHVAETLLSTTAVLFLVLAVKAARLRELTFGDIRQGNWKKVRRPAVFSILSALFLGMYIFAWQGALLLVFAIASYFVIQFVIDHLKRRATDYLAIVGIIIFLVALLFIPVAPTGLYAPSLLIAVLIPFALWTVSRLMARRGIQRGFYPLVIIVLGLAGLGLFYLISPTQVRSMLNAFSIFAPSGTLLATIEVQSIFAPVNATGNIIQQFTSTPAWFNFYWALPASLIALAVIIIHSMLMKGNAEKGAFVVWSAVMLVATIGQRRFAYYFAVNVALLAGFASVLVYYLITWLMIRTGGDRTRSLSSSALDLEGLRERPVVRQEAASPATKKARRRGMQEARRLEMQRLRMKRDQAKAVRQVRDYVSTGLSAIVIFVLLFGPMVIFPADTRYFGSNATEPWYKRTPTGITAKSTPYAASDAWFEALDWVKTNTPEPLGSSDAYYRRYANQRAGQSFDYPASAYGVLAWWDYGYWITYIGHRMPNANPGQDQTAVRKVASFFIAQDEASAEAIAAELDSDYVIMDYQTATSKFWAVVTWAGRTPAEFFDTYYTTEGQPKTLIYPEYYRALSTRLYSFDGQAVTEQSPTVYAFEEIDQNGTVFRVITSETPFQTYEEAAAFVAGQTSGKYVIASIDPLISPVSLEALQHYRPVYSSTANVTVSSTKQTAEIKVFERE
ncbi:MAG: hypothetical protein A2147_08560 [Chloroflexi bacterium RBG_16_57_8]|nr:MAG: hypothetical protein A2147_08560 [Chloroflexi bacterium RBG_16_57_8]